jgi:hypothetical protein
MIMARDDPSRNEAGICAGAGDLCPRVISGPSNDRFTASPLSSAFLQRLALLTDLHSNKSEVACGASKADFRS